MTHEKLNGMEKEGAIKIFIFLLFPLYIFPQICICVDPFSFN